MEIDPIAAALLILAGILVSGLVSAAVSIYVSRWMMREFVKEMSGILNAQFELIGNISENQKRIVETRDKMFESLQATLDTMRQTMRNEQIAFQNLMLSTFREGKAQGGTEQPKDYPVDPTEFPGG